MKIDFTNIFATGQISQNEFEKTGEKIPEFLDKISTRRQGFYQIFDDPKFQAEVEEIKKFAEFSNGKYSDIVICGIGGSALGARTIRNALTSKFSTPRLHILDNVDAEIIAEITENLDFAKTLFLVISKSGGTIETRTQYEYFRGILTHKKLELKNNLVFITGKFGFLREESNNRGIIAFSVPENIGGRFSVLTAVGLLPAALLGIDIDELLAGGQNSAKLFMSENFSENLPFQLAATQFLDLQSNSGQAKKNINVLMPYSTKLGSFADWFAQLLAESTGKDDKGITPISAQGVTDQHSQLQIFVDGPKDKLVIFIETEKSSPDLAQDKNLPKSGLQIFQKLMHAEKKGTAQSLTEKNVPNLTIQIPAISAKFLGELFMLFMGATAFLGEFMEINAFDQPGVERGKVLTRHILK